MYDCSHRSLLLGCPRLVSHCSFSSLLGHGGCGSGGTVIKILVLFCRHHYLVLVGNNIVLHSPFYIPSQTSGLGVSDSLDDGLYIDILRLKSKRSRDAFNQCIVGNVLLSTFPFIYISLDELIHTRIDVCAVCVGGSVIGNFLLVELIPSPGFQVY